MRTRILTNTLLSLLISAWAASGCSNSDSGSMVEVGVTSNAQALAVAAPGDAAGAASGSLLVTITRVSVHVAGGDGDDDGKGRDDKGAPEAEPADDEKGGGWQVVFEGSKQVNLRDAATTEAFLAEQQITAGKITQIRLLLADDAAVVDGERSAPVTCSSCSTTGLKIVTSGKLTAPEGGKVHLTLDFDQQASLTGDASGYRLAPVVRLKGEGATLRQSVSHRRPKRSAARPAGPPRPLGQTSAASRRPARLTRLKRAWLRRARRRARVEACGLS